MFALDEKKLLLIIIIYFFVMYSETAFLSPQLSSWSSLLISFFFTFLWAFTLFAFLLFYIFFFVTALFYFIINAFFNASLLFLKQFVSDRKLRPLFFFSVASVSSHFATSLAISSSDGIFAIFL